MFDEILTFIRQAHKKNVGFLPLHEPRFLGNEKKYVADAIDSTFVSSVGEYVDKAERKLEALTGAKKAVLFVNGTAALHLSLKLAGVGSDSEVITQALTFIATANAIKYCHADPVFIDVDLDTMGLSPKALETFLQDHISLQNGEAVNKKTGKKIKACVPMHTFGHPCRIDEIVEICKRWNIAVIEDAAEALGSEFKNKKIGNFGFCSALSFNGNKIITAGGGGALLFNDEKLGARAKHLSTTAKIPHAWDFKHDEIGYNYRMPNLNAALLLAQLENLEDFLKAKRLLADKTKDFFKDIKDVEFIQEPKDSRANYWLMALRFSSLEMKDSFLKISNEKGVMTRPIWTLMSELEMFKDAQHDSLKNSKLLAETVVNIPSSVVL